MRVACDSPKSPRARCARELLVKRGGALELLPRWSGRCAELERTTKPGSRVERLLRQSAPDRQVIEELYLTALSRLPEAAEERELEQLTGRQEQRTQAFGYLLWGLISSREFASSH